MIHIDGEGGEGGVKLRHQGMTSIETGEGKRSRN